MKQWRNCSLRPQMGNIVSKYDHTTLVESPSHSPFANTSNEPRHLFNDERE
jgi:hypothetical protein